ncbi:MAG TPA: glycosyltransferase family 87 protein [Vicinamibacterales bacterium]
MITARRVRGYATVGAICLWAIVALDFSVAGPMDRLGKVKGTDFLHFYVIGSIARQGRWSELYDAGAQYERARAIAPASSEVIFVPVESPQLALLFAPLSAWSYTAALMAWLAIGGVLYVMCCWLLWRDATALHPYRKAFVAACAAFPGMFTAVLHGQTAWLSLLCVVAALAALRRERRFAAGLALGLLVFKPHWALVAGGLFLCAGEWRIVAGIVASAAAQVALTWAVVGSSLMRTYAGVLITLPRIAALLEPKPGDSLRGYFQAVFASTPVSLAAFVAAALASVWLATRIWRSGGSLDLRLAAMVIALILVNPHVNAYDLLLLAPVCALLGNWIVENGAGVQAATPVESGVALMPRLAVLLFVAPLLGGLPALVRLQFSVGAMVAILVLTGYLLRRRIWFWMPWNAGATSAAVGA